VTKQRVKIWKFNVEVIRRPCVLTAIIPNNSLQAYTYNMAAGLLQTECGHCILTLERKYVDYMCIGYLGTICLERV